MSWPDAVPIATLTAIRHDLRAGTRCQGKWQGESFFG